MTQAHDPPGATLAPGIFIVEDQTLVAKDIAKTLLALGYRVLGRARNATAAMLTAPQLNPDLILMDIGLPGGVDGVATAVALRDKTGIPVVFLSGASDLETRTRAGKSDPFGYIVKPFKAPELRGAIEIALRRSRLEAAGRERERLLFMTLRSIADGVVTTNDQEKVTFLNPMAERLTGWSSAEASGHPLAEVMPLRNESTGEAVAPLRAALDELRATNAPKGTLLLGRSETVAIEESAAPIVADGADLLGGVVVFRDSSVQQRLEEQLRSYQKLEIIGQLTCAIAHDFNNVLAAILLCSRFLAQSFDEDDPRRLDAEEIEKAGNRGAALTRQLLSFGRRQALEPTVLNLSEVLVELEHMLRLLAGDIELTISGGHDLRSVTVDRGQIEQVIVNLVINARDAMPGGGSLHIETSNLDLEPEQASGFQDLQPGPLVVLTVTDTGCGMDAATLARAFEPSFTTKEQAKGTGLGLSTSHDIVKRSRGEIRLFSEIKRGTIAKVYLPASDGRPSSHPPELAAARRADDETETILLIEGDTAVRQAVSRTLEACGYCVLKASDGVEALAIAEAHTGPVHLLLSDVMARGIGGAQPLAKLKARYTDARVLFMSGYADRGVGNESRLPSVIQKPFSSDALARKVRIVLDAR